MRVLGWRAYFSGGRTYDSVLHTWGELPRSEALVFVVYHPRPYRTVVDGGDWYWLDGGMVRCSPTHEQKGSWVPRCGGDSSIAGLWVDDDVFAAVKAEAMAAKECP